MTCKHKYVHRNSDSFKYTNGRYSWAFVHIDYYFCEKCLKEESVKKQAHVSDHEIPHKLPDWARMITTKVQGYE